MVYFSTQKVKDWNPRRNRVNNRLNVCIGLIFFALAWGGGPDGWEAALFGTGILMILTGEWESYFRT